MNSWVLKKIEVSRSWASLRGVVLCQFDDLEVLHLAGIESEAHKGAMDLWAEGAGCARIEYEGSEMSVVHGAADVAVSAHEEGDGVLPQFGEDVAGPFAGIASDVGHPDADAFERETLVLGITKVHILPIGVAPDDSARLARGFQSVADGDIDDIAGEPYLVACFKVLQVTIVPQSVGVAHQADGFHISIVATAPEVEGVVGLNLVLDVVGEVVEEVVAGDALDLIDRVGVLPDAALAVFVGEDEADGVVAVVLFGADYLEEGRGYCNLALHHQMDVIDNGTAAYPHLAIAACPCATKALDLLPKPGIEFLVLGTDVRSIVTFVHGIFVPLHVARGCHMTARISRFGVVVRGNLLSLHKGVGFEIAVAFAIGCTGLFAGQFPSHPVGFVPDVVVGDDVAGVLDDLLPGIAACSGKFSVVGRRIGMGRLVGRCIGGNRGLGNRRCAALLGGLLHQTGDK